jgi:hypothetical protein
MRDVPLVVARLVLAIVVAAGCSLAPFNPEISCRTADTAPGAVDCHTAIEAVRAHVPPGSAIAKMSFDIGMPCRPPGAPCPYTPFIGTVIVERVDGATERYSVTSEDGRLIVALVPS